MKNDQLQALWDNVQRYNDEEAFALLFKEFYVRLVIFSIDYVSAREQAEEIVGDVFVKLWDKRSTLKQINNISAYLFVAVRNQSLNYIKQYSRMRVVADPEEPLNKLVEEFNPQREMEWKELAAKMEHAVNMLPQQCRTVFKLIKEEGFKYKEVAQILHISPRTVETQLVRAMAKLHQILDDYLAADRQYPQKKRNELLHLLLALSFC